MLTEFIRFGDIRDKIRREFPRSKPLYCIKKPLLAPPITGSYTQVGTAFDYLLRFYLKKINPKAKTKNYWIAEAAADLLPFGVLQRKAYRIILAARKNYETYLKKGKMNRLLMRSTLLLAQLDPIYRAYVIDENLGSVKKEDIDDLHRLIAIVNPSDFAAKGKCLLNPTFGEGSLLVGGADADLIIGDTIIDIKTSKYLRFDRRAIDQLLGYYFLSLIRDSSRKSAKYRIRNLGIYYSRYGYLHKMAIRQLDASNYERVCRFIPQKINIFRMKIRNKQIASIHDRYGGIFAVRNPESLIEYLYFGREEKPLNLLFNINFTAFARSLGNRCMKNLFARNQASFGKYNIGWDKDRMIYIQTGNKRKAFFFDIHKLSGLIFFDKDELWINTNRFPAFMKWFIRSAKKYH